MKTVFIVHDHNVLCNKKSIVSVPRVSPARSPGTEGTVALVECWVMKYRVYLEPDEDGVFVVTCPALPGCVSQGRTRVEATENIREAIEGYLKNLRKHGDPLPPSILEEVIEVAGG